MKSSLTKIFLFILFLLVCYTAIFSIVKLEQGNFGIVIDLRYNRIIKTFDQRYNFIFQGAMPWWYSIDTMSSRRSLTLDLKIPIPELEPLKDDLYTIRIPISVLFTIDTDRFFNYDLLNGNGKELNKRVNKYIINYFLKEIQQYISPRYRKELLDKNINRFIDRVVENITAQLNSIGLKLDQFDITGTVVSPDIKTYYEGITYLRELRLIERKHKRELEELKVKLEKFRIQHEYTYNDLREISKIIKDNPAILKYIYIDKLASNVKVILSSDRSGVPDFLHDESGSQEKKGDEIDNLR